MEGSWATTPIDMAVDGPREVWISGKDKVLLHESHDTCDPATGRALTGSWLWESSVLLVEWMASEEGRAECDLSGKIVLELGAGTGLPGLAAAAFLGAKRVVLTDVAPLLPSLRKNVQVNGLAGKVDVQELSWGSGADLSLVVGEGVDVVLMSDVFYDPSEMGGLVRTLRDVCTSASRIWAASEARVGVVDCLNVFISEGFKVVELPVIERQLLRSPGRSAEFKMFLISLPNLPF